MTHDTDRPKVGSLENDTRSISDRARQHIEALTNQLEKGSAAADTGLPLAAEAWIDKGVVEVPVADLPAPDGIAGAGDFHKVSEADMAAGLRKLQDMQAAIQDSRGQSTDFWSAYDHAHKLDYEHGYQRIYEAFYGDDAIRLNFVDGEYEIVNGRHRIWLAKQTGLASLPARVIERERSDK